MDYRNLFYFDIETVGKYKDYATFKENDTRGAELFEKKYSKWFKDRFSSVEDAYLNNAPIHSVYGKIVCVSFGYFTNKNEKGYTIGSIYNDDEVILLKEVSELFEKVSRKFMVLSGFKINGFDIPWLVHKMIKYSIPIPSILQIFDKKPWEINSFDLDEKWRLNEKYYYSLDEVCYEMDLASPKDDLNGSMVHHTYWIENDLLKIKTYCEKDVKQSMLVGKRMLE